MELKRPFGIETLLSPATAREIFDRATRACRTTRSRRMGLLQQFQVAVVCSTDDPTDSLEAHSFARAARRPRHRASTPRGGRTRPCSSRTSRRGPPGSGSSRRPRRRPIGTLGRAPRRAREAARVLPRDGLPGLRPRARDSSTRSRGTTRPRRSSSTGCAAAGALDAAEARVFRSALLHRLALLDHARGWVQQFHLGALRNNNTRMRTAPRPRHRLRLDRRLRAGAAARALPRPARRDRTSSRRRSSTT